MITFKLNCTLLSIRKYKQMHKLHSVKCKQEQGGMGIKKSLDEWRVLSVKKTLANSALGALQVTHTMLLDIEMNNRAAESAVTVRQ